VRLKEDFSGRLIMNTAGSQLGIGDVEHRGTGTLVVGANDALGFLTLRFENAAAKIESGNGARTIANAVIADTGFTLTGQNSMTFSGTVNLGNTGTSKASWLVTVEFRGMFMWKALWG
jgi:cellulase/cellobiase CelA1